MDAASIGLRRWIVVTLIGGAFAAWLGVPETRSSSCVFGHGKHNLVCTRAPASFADWKREQVQREMRARLVMELDELDARIADAEARLPALAGRCSGRELQARVDAMRAHRRELAGQVAARERLRLANDLTYSEAARPD